ncbi:MAG: MSEP-CTERM sorting domain-containing protein [Candidatus Omnitrophota bacterium]
MNNTAVNRSLLPDFIKKPIFMLWVYIIPQMILLLINLWSGWLVWDDLPAEKMPIVYMILGMELGLLGLAFMIGIYSHLRKSLIGLAWNGLLLAAHIGYLWFVSSNVWRLIPGTVEPWILDQGMLVFYQFTFMMPGLFYAGLRLACFEVNIKNSSDIGYSFLLTILGPLLYYVVFIFMGKFTRPFAWAWAPQLAAFFFIGVTVAAFVGLVRLVVLLYNFIRSRGDTAQSVFAVIVSIVGPLAGLWLNQSIPFPASFQTPWVYVLAVINGLIMIIPSVRKTDSHGYLLFARSVTYPFTVYFFLVFLPFLPLSLPAIFAVGTGFLIMVPVALFLLHTKRIHDDFQLCRRARGALLSVVLVVAGCAILPGYFTSRAFQDKAALKSALKYVYSPNYEKDVSFSGSVRSVKRTLVNLKQFKEGIQLPYLSGFYNRVVFEGMVLPDSRVEYLYKLFAGEEFKKDGKHPAWRFDGLMTRGRGRRFNPRPVTRDRNVELASFKVSVEQVTDFTRSRIHLNMQNKSASDTAEFFRELEIPSGVLITDFQLKVDEEMVPGQIFEKRTAMWVYHMIRDFTRRDPGLLNYVSAQRVHFSVYPFLKDQVREAIIEFSFPKGLNPSVKFGDELIPLVSGQAVQPSIYLSQLDEHRAAVIIPEHKLKELSSGKPPAYFHFILDYSKGSKGGHLKYMDQISAVLNKYGDSAVGHGKITAANFDLQDVTPEYIDLNDRAQVRNALGRITLGHKGSLNLERAIKHDLVRRPSAVKINGQSLEPYPVFVVISTGNPAILDLQDMDFYQTLSPYENEYLLSTGAGDVTKKPLWSRPDFGKTEDAITLSFGGVVSRVPAATGQPLIIPFNGPFNTAELKVLNPATHQFDPVPGVQRMEFHSEYADGLRLQLENLEILHNPAVFEEKLPAIVKAGKKSGLMTFSTSFIVVERSTQWKILSVKEKQRLAATGGLEFEEDFNTPSPSALILLLLLLVWYFLRDKFCFRGLPRINCVKN